MRRSYRDHCESCLYLGDHTVQQKRLSTKTKCYISNIPRTIMPYLILTFELLIVLAINFIIIERNIGIVSIISLLAGIAIKSSSTAATSAPTTASTTSIFATVWIAGREEISKGLFLTHMLPFAVKIRGNYIEVKWIGLYIGSAIIGGKVNGMESYWNGDCKSYISCYVSH